MKKNNQNTRSKIKPRSQVAAKAKLPSKFGTFIMYAFSPFKDGFEHIAIVKGDVTGKEKVATRIHSECLTGDALGSLRCDCGDQLQKSLAYIGKKRRGIVFYLKQEGRGIGLVNKIKAYELQDSKKVDTYDANVMLGFKPDERSFEVVAEMLKALEVASIELMTNNPKKIEDLRARGIKIHKRLPHAGNICKENEHYLMTKKDRFGHMLKIQTQGLA